jgi:hypothetical protein
MCHESLTKPGKAMFLSAPAAAHISAPEQWPCIVEAIYRAFAGVQLEDGIGYFEAEAIDDYVKKDDPAYQQYKERDERLDWCKVVATFMDDSFNFDWSRNCFMDAKGLRFYLPVWMVSGYEDELDVVFKKIPGSALQGLLNAAQKECILAYHAYRADHEDWIRYYMNLEADRRPGWGERQDDPSLPYEEAVRLAENQSEYRLWQFLRQHL